MRAKGLHLGVTWTQCLQMVLPRVDLFNLPARAVVEALREKTPVEPDPDDPASFVAPDLSPSLWRPFEADDDPHEEQGFYFSSELLAAPGCCDTPAQAAARAPTNLKRNQDP